MSTSRKKTKCALTIAGSDPAGAAGLQGDLKTFAACGMHGLSVVTAVTAQNLERVTSIHNVPAREVEQQLDTLIAGFDIAAVKIGMLGSAANVAAVAAALRRRRLRNIVLDPVLASSSGTRLLSARGVAALRHQLIPLADLLTPNLPEAEILLGQRIPAGSAATAARELLGLGARAVLLKGGHASGRAVSDWLADAQGLREFRHPRLAVRARGTGCALSAAIAAGLAGGKALPAAVEAAEQFLQRALHMSDRPGKSALGVLGFARI